MTIALELLRRFWPYIVAFAIGFSMAWGIAWKIQGVRLDRAQNEFTDYKLEQQRIVQESIDLMNKKRQEVANDFLSKEAALKKDIEAGEVFKPDESGGGKFAGCVVPTCSPGISLPALGGSNANGPDAISAFTGTTEDPVIGDCAQTTLILNQLQKEVENQEGY